MPHDIDSGAEGQGDDLSAPRRNNGGVQQWQLIPGLRLSNRTVGYAIKRVAAFNLRNGTGWTLRVFPAGTSPSVPDASGNDPTTVAPGSSVERHTTASEQGVWKDWGGTVGVILFGGPLAAMVPVGGNVVV